MQKVCRKRTAHLLFHDRPSYTTIIRHSTMPMINGLTKFPSMREGDHEYGSVQRLIPLSSCVKTMITPLRSTSRSKPLNRRVTRGMIPFLAASKTSRTSLVVFSQPDNKGISGDVTRSGEGDVEGDGDGRLIGEETE